MRFIAILTLFVAAATSSGCRRHVVVHERHDHDPDVVVIERGHVHTDHCGHFFHRGHWRHHHGHVHRHGCGHHFRGGLWVVVD